MVRFLFWNIDESTDTFPHLVRLAQSRELDVILLAEANSDLAPLVGDLCGIGKGNYTERADINFRFKVKVITRLRKRDFSPSFTSAAGDMTLWKLRVPGASLPEVLIAALHLPSKTGGMTPASQAETAFQVAEDIRAHERRRGHENTVVVGDFNMEPFDPGMVLVSSFHGLMTRRLALLPHRVYRKEPYPRFYNPMWGLFGDRTAGPAGTHFWDASVSENHHWAMLDQVLVRGPLIDRLGGPEILDSDGTVNLTNAEGTPEKGLLSDHLPLYFELDL